jgi:hypothetical protein
MGDVLMAQLDLVVYVEVIVSGGAVATMDTGVFTALESDTPYCFDMGIVNANAGFETYTFAINNNTTGTEYDHSYASSNNSGSTGTGAPWVYSWTDLAHAFGFVSSFNPVAGTRHPNIAYTGLQNTNATQQSRFASGTINLASTETFTQLQITGSAGSIGDGSYIRIWKQIQS